MGALLADKPLPVIEGLALVTVSIGLILASAARARSTQPASRIVQIFWRDVSQAGYLWSAATVVLLFGALGEIEGVRTPIWLVLAVVVGSIAVAVVRLRWVRFGMAATRSTVDDPSRLDPPASRRHPGRSPCSAAVGVHYSCTA